MTRPSGPSPVWGLLFYAFLLLVAYHLIEEHRAHRWVVASFVGMFVVLVLLALALIGDGGRART